MSSSNMRYITKVQLCNFQDHKDTEIKLEPGINLIIGSSDAGKSAILRAINFVFHNQPSGNSFIRKGSDEAFASITFSDGYVITRVKGASRNAIMVEKPDGQQLMFEKIGREIPPEAIEALGNPPIDDKHGPLSYCEQMAPYFLVSLTPTELPRSISELTGINDFEEAAQLLGKRSRTAERQMKECQSRIDGYEKSLEQYADLDAKLENLEALEKKAKTIEGMENSISKINNFINEYKRIMEIIDKANKRYKKRKAIADFEDRLPELQAIYSVISSMESLHEMYCSNMEQEKKAKETIDKLTSVTSENITKKMSVIKKLIEYINNIEALLNQYQELMKKGNSIKDKYEVWRVEHKKLVDEHKIIVRDMKKQGLWCEVCDRPAFVKEHSHGDK